MFGALVRVRDYVFFERNPLVQIIYFVAMGSCYYLYMREAHPLLPNEYVGWYHKWLATFLFAATIALYLVMCMSDPGVIQRDNIHEFEQYVNHPVLYPEGKYCRTCCRDPSIVGCATTASADSTISTCSVFFSQVEIRSNNCACCCVIECPLCRSCKCYRETELTCLPRNVKSGSMAALGRKTTNTSWHICWYSWLLGKEKECQVLTSLCATQTDDLFLARGVTMEEVGRTETAKIMQSFIANNQALGFVTAMCLLIGIILWVFILMQLKRIAQNETANESFKREDLREKAELDGETSGRRMFRFLFKRLNFRKRPKLAVPRRELKKTLDASWGGLFSPDSIMNTEESFQWTMSTSTRTNSVRSRKTY
ncbi:hypothetical protein GQ600_23929 [Phytophthora cactorum]|nr:hypothetical protein GQ600_23929 [Phytophthora cactorum]